eukprot:COSAG01_NODE_2483_length_7600_cov_4.742034_2_plen_154_part_00
MPGQLHARRLNNRTCQVSRGGPPPVGGPLLRGDDHDDDGKTEEAEAEEGGEPTEDGEGDVAEEDGAPPPPPTLEAQAGEELAEPGELEFGEVPEGALTPQMEQMALKTSLVRESSVCPAPPSPFRSFIAIRTEAAAEIPYVSVHFHFIFGSPS